VFLNFACKDKRFSPHHQTFSRFSSEKQKKHFAISRESTIFADEIGEDRLHLNNKNKKVAFLFCIVFDLHYLCSGF